MSYQLGVPPNPLSSPSRSQTPTSSQTSTISLTSTPSPYTQEMYAIQGSSSGGPMDQHPQYVMSPPPPPGRGRGSPYQQVVLINHVDQTKQQDAVAGRGKRATPKGKGGGGRKTPHAAAQVPASEPADSDEVQVVVDMGVPTGGRRGGSRPPPMDKETKKERTRENEKERRAHQKNGMKRLRELIPKQPEDENNKKRTINDGQVVNMAANYIELLLQQIAEMKKEYEVAKGAAKRFDDRIKTIAYLRAKEVKKFNSIIAASRSEVKAADTSVNFALRTTKKLEMATDKLRYYHEFAVKNPDKVKPLEFDMRFFDVERERLPPRFKNYVELMEVKYGGDTFKMLDDAYVVEVNERAKRERAMRAMAIEGTLGEEGGRQQGGQVVGHGGQQQQVNVVAVNKQQQQQVNVVAVNKQQQQMNLAKQQQQHQMNVAVNKQQQQILMGVQGNQAGLRNAQLTHHQVNQVTKIIPAGMRLPNIGSARVGQQQVRLVTLKQDTGGESQLMRCQAPNDRQLKITGGNVIFTHSQNGQPLILRSNDGTQLYSLANIQQEHQGGVGQSGRVVMGVVKPQLFQNVQGLVRGPGPRGLGMQPQQTHVRVVKRDLFQDGGVQVVQGQQQGPGIQNIQRQQSPVGKVVQRQQGCGGQVGQQLQSYSSLNVQRVPVGIQQQLGIGGQVVQQEQGARGRSVQQQQGIRAQVNQQQQGIGAQVIQQQQQGIRGQVIQQLQRTGGQVIQQQQGIGAQVMQQKQGPGIQTIQQQQATGDQVIQQQAGIVGNAVQQERLGQTSQQQQEPGIDQQQSPVNQTTEQQICVFQGARSQVPSTPRSPHSQRTGLLAIKHEPMDEDGRDNSEKQAGDQIDQILQPEYGVEANKKGTEDGGRESDRLFGDTSMDPVFGDYTFDALIDGMDSQTGPFGEGLGGADQSFEMGLVGLDSPDHGLFSRDVSMSSQGGTSRGSSGSCMDGYDLGKVKQERVDEDEGMGEDTQRVDISGVKQERDEDEVETDGGSEVDDGVSPPRMVESGGNSTRLSAWKIDGIGDEVEDEVRTREDFSRCPAQVENMPGCVRRIWDGVKPGESSSEPREMVVREEEPCTSQVPAIKGVEYQVQQLTVEQWKGHDELFRKHPLFKHDFLWGEQKNPKKSEQVMAIIDRCWAEVVAEREAKDKAEVENAKKRKIVEENDDDYEDKGKGRKGGSRGRKKKK